MKYTVTDTTDYIAADDPEGTRVVHVHTKGRPEWMQTHVWWDPKLKAAHCCACSSILIAMSQSCVHAKAVKRFMSKP